MTRDYRLSLLEDIFGGRIGDDAVPPKGLDAAISATLLTLESRESDVLNWRYKEGLTLSECSKRLFNLNTKTFGVNRERIRQIEAKALRKLRCPPRALMLKPYTTAVGLERY